VNLFGLSPGELILIALVAMIVLGPEKLPETAASVGRWIREFRRVTQELTQQFADDNPFTEIQRALSLTDEPVAVAAVPEPAPLETSNAEYNVGHASADLQTVGIPATSNGVVARSPRRSDYFDHPTYYSAIDDAWTHGGLNGYHKQGPGSELLRLPISDEWAHGVPIPLPRVELPETVTVDDVPSIAISDGVVEKPLDTILETTSEVNSDAIEPGPLDVAIEAASAPIDDSPSTTELSVESPPLAEELVDAREGNVKSNGHVESTALDGPIVDASSESDSAVPESAIAGQTEESRS
jgi:sec-independent protein translocase protein TatB